MQKGYARRQCTAGRNDIPQIQQYGIELVQLSKRIRRDTRSRTKRLKAGSERTKEVRRLNTGTLFLAAAFQLATLARIGKCLGAWKIGLVRERFECFEHPRNI